VVVYELFVEGKLEAAKTSGPDRTSPVFRAEVRSSIRERSGVCRMPSRRRSRNWIRFRNSGRQRSWEVSRSSLLAVILGYCGRTGQAAAHDTKCPCVCADRTRFECRVRIPLKESGKLRHLNPHRSEPSSLSCRRGSTHCRYYPARVWNTLMKSHDESHGRPTPFIGSALVPTGQQFSLLRKLHYTHTPGNSVPINSIEIAVRINGNPRRTIL